MFTNPQHLQRLSERHTPEHKHRQAHRHANTHTPTHTNTKTHKRINRQTNTPTQNNSNSTGIFCGSLAREQPLVHDSAFMRFHFFIRLQRTQQTVTHAQQQQKNRRCRHCVPTAPTTSIREAQTTTNRYRPVHVGGPGVDELLHHRESHRREAVTCAAPLQVRTRRDPVDLSAHRVVTFRYLCVCGRAVQLLIGRTGGVSVYIFVISV